MISTHISKTNNNSKCEQTLNRNESQIFFHKQFWLLQNNSFCFLYMKCSLDLDWLQMPMGYVSFPFNLEKGMKTWKNDEPIKWTIKMME